MEQVCVSVQKQDGCLLHSLKTVTICNFNTSWLSTVHFVAAIVYTVGAKITSTINKKESTISVFQSPLISLFSVSDGKTAAHYQQHSLFNYSYEPAHSHCCMKSLNPQFCFPFFNAFKKICFLAAWRCGEWQLEQFWLVLVVCLRTFVVHTLTDQREWRSTPRPWLLTQQSFARNNDELYFGNMFQSKRRCGLGLYQLCTYFDLLFGYERSHELQL